MHFLNVDLPHKILVRLAFRSICLIFETLKIRYHGDQSRSYFFDLSSIIKLVLKFFYIMFNFPAHSVDTFDVLGWSTLEHRDAFLLGFLLSTILIPVLH